MNELYIGLMSGTSLDGVDAILLDVDNGKVKLIETHSETFPDPLYELLHNIITTQQTSLQQLADADHMLGVIYSLAVKKLLHKANLMNSQIRAIGCHGQTIYHQPEGDNHNSLQLGDPSFIVETTGITVVADFRRRDMAAAGQGAPLVPAFHAAVFHNSQIQRVILNIGGIANITVLPRDKRQATTGFDTGPGNTLLDQWVRSQCNLAYDEDGNWSASGKVVEPMLVQMLNDPYFAKSPPKSTGREYFNLAWLEKFLSMGNFAPQDIQATLLELTCQSISKAIKKHAAGTQELYVCGGGSRNAYMLKRLSQLVEPINVQTTAVMDIAPDWVEAAAFAWLARQTMHNLPGNLPDVTGATRPVVLGAIYPAGI